MKGFFKKILKKISTVDFYIELIARFLRFFIRKNPIGFFAPKFNRRYPYWSAVISAATIVVLVLSTSYFVFFRGGKEVVQAAWWPLARRANGPEGTILFNTFLCTTFIY
jgi:hypothetical protein